MLSYQHSYHAGCFADVMKHAILTRLLVYLTQKDKALLYLDTHSGRGLYDLQHAHALKTNEAVQGIYPVWKKREQFSSLFEPYLQAIQKVNLDNNLRYYPGSPAIALELLRAQDRSIFCELHPGEFTYLQQLPTSNKRVIVKKEDGIKNLNLLLPPVERRGLVFIDPSYERKTEYQEMIQAIKLAYKRSSTMTYCLWYPLLNNQLPAGFLQSMQAFDVEKKLRLEFYITQKSKPGMTGSGLWIVNPPYTLAEEGEKMLKELGAMLAPKEAGYLAYNK